MCVRQLVFQHLQQICNDVESLGQQTNSLVHLQVASDSLVNGFKLRLCPHELGSVKDRTLQVYVNSQNEELADLHVNLTTSEVDAAGAGDGGRN